MQNGGNPCFATPAGVHLLPECQKMAKMETRDRLIPDIPDHPVERFAVALDRRRRPTHLVARPLQKERREHPDRERVVIPRVPGKTSLDDGLCGNLDKSGDL